ncbi:phosphate ABC transporter substrate-binding protein PstS [Acidocella sp.]|jgi:phosphate transport system substrate-binding protein|uniref:phosphate ABC transporter substrate-binding protein PstS n=1 Tax=Acidocella sp. TaxID=50710 RepID=UPI002F426758
MKRMSSRSGLIAAPMLVAAFSLLLGAPGKAAAATIALHETGSTLIYPLFELWIPDYQGQHPDVAITAGATGSGDGIAKAIAGAVQIGTSDAYMSEDASEQNPQILNIPLAISAQTVNYDVPGLTAPLKLDGPTLAGIYSGQVTMWDAPEIAALNPGLALPHHQIVPVHRADAAGDTFIFTQFLELSAQSWDDATGYGTTVNWPFVPAAATAIGNGGMVQTLAQTPYSIGYIGISFRAAIAKTGLGTAMLKNQDGKFLLPTPDTIAAAAAVLDPRTPPDERLTLVFASGDESYPLINYEYAVVSKNQKDALTAEAVRHFLLWAISADGGNAPKYLNMVGFIPLPDFIRGLSEAQIALVQ